LAADIIAHEDLVGEVRAQGEKIDALIGAVNAVGKDVRMV
jgi:hypothetical protein